MSVERVVVPVDGSPTSAAALPAGVSLATRLGAGLDVLMVRPASDAPAARAVLDGIAVPAGAEPLRRVVELGGTPADAIVAHANHPSELVCLATHGHTGVGTAICGSTAERVLRSAERPVVLVGPHARPGIDWGERATIVVCVGASPDGERTLAVAELAALLEAEVRLVTEVIVGDGLERDPVVRPDRLATLEHLAEQFERRGVRASYEIVPGHDLWPPINAAADAAKASLLAVTSEARTGVGRVLLGSDAITIVRHSPVPVVALHDR